MVSPEILTAPAVAVRSNTRTALLPEIVSRLAPGPLIVTLLLTVNVLFNVIVPVKVIILSSPEKPEKLMVSPPEPAFTRFTANRSEPGSVGSSVKVVTLKTAADAICGSSKINPIRKE